jgi:serine/threonine-protein kinase HipA
MAETLEVWLGDRKVAVKVAVIERERRKLRLSYTDEALAAYPGGTPLLSLNLPLTAGRYPNARTRAFLDGLLPEGEPRRAIAANLDLPASDVFGLLAALGKDCAGALVIQPEGEPPPESPAATAAEPLSPDDLATLIANLPDAPLGIDRKVRLSLAGVQQKLLLTRMQNGRWSRPVAGTPSTHILKPEIERFTNTVENEAFCMEIARQVGLAVAETEIVLVDERPVLVVERYDRTLDADGSVKRIHQEDFCQALGLPPERKYEEGGGPSLARIAGVLREVAPAEALHSFLRAVTLNVSIGNCDAHAKNFSLLHTDAFALRPAPLYDLISTRFYPLDDRLAMCVDRVQRVDRVTADRIVNEAAGWGMGRVNAEEIVADVLERLPKAIVAAANEIAGVPEELVDLVCARTKRLRGASVS